MARIDINPAVLAWAMTESKRSEADLAAATGRDIATVHGWLSGAEAPFKKDIEAAARLLYRPVQIFFLPAPPSSSPFPVNRRTALSGIIDATSEELAAYREANRLQKLARWVLDRTDQTQKTVYPVTKDSPEQYAAELRNWLEWDTSRQVKASSKGAVFRLLRDAVEATGTLVFLKEASLDSSPGFSLPDERAPAIFINASYQLGSVRSFTLLHELAHLARGDSSLHHDYSSETERWCERFAAAFLIPQNLLSSYLSRGPVSKLERNDLNQVRLISNRYGASWQAVSIRLINLGLADPYLYESVKNGEQKEPGGPGGDPRTTAVLRLDEFGGEFSRILIDGRQAELLPKLDVLRYLRVDEAQYHDLLQLSGAGVD